MTTEEIEKENGRSKGMEERKKERLISKNGITKEEIEWVIEIKEEVKIGEGEREENEGGIGERKEKEKF